VANSAFTGQAARDDLQIGGSWRPAELTRSRSAGERRVGEERRGGGGKFCARLWKKRLTYGPRDQVPRSRKLWRASDSATRMVARCRSVGVDFGHLTVSSIAAHLPLARRLFASSHPSAPVPRCVGAWGEGGDRRGADSVCVVVSAPSLQGQPPMDACEAIDTRIEERV
jgi:hypothetical protein